MELSFKMEDNRDEQCTYSAVFPGMDSVIFSSLRELAKKNVLMDLSLIMHDGKTLKAHKIILAAISGYFENVLQKIPPQQSAVACLGKEFDGMENLLKLIYEDEVIFSCEAEQNDFRRFCEYLKIRNWGTILFSRDCRIEPKAYDQNKRKRGPKRKVTANENCSVLEQLLLNSSPEYQYHATSSNGDRPLNLSFSPPAEHPSMTSNNGTDDDEDEDGRIQPYLKIRSEESLREGNSSDEGRKTGEVCKTLKHGCDYFAPTVFKQEPNEPRRNGTTIENVNVKEDSCVQQTSEALGSQLEAAVRSDDTMEFQRPDSNESASSSAREITAGAKNASTASATNGRSTANSKESSKISGIQTPNTAKKTGPTNKGPGFAANGQARPKTAVKRKQAVNWPYPLPPSYSDLYHNYASALSTQMKGMQDASGPSLPYPSFSQPPARLPSNALKLMPPFVGPKTSQKKSIDTSAFRTMTSMSKTSNFTNGDPRKKLVGKKSGSQAGSKGPLFNLPQAIASAISGGPIVKKPRTKMDAMRGVPSSYSQAGMNGLTQQFLHSNSSSSESGLSVSHVSDVRKSAQVSHDKPFKCHLCPKQFVYQKAYLVHISQHNCDFTCEACQKSFSTQQYLDRHKEDGKCLAKSSNNNQL